MAKRVLMMLAHPFKAAKHGISGWLLSEKLDGMRCFWDGGLTRGQPKVDVPWANNDKDERYITPPVATGLWSRYGNVIHAPDWWLDQLPNMFLDGELFTKRQDRQNMMAIVKDIIPGDGWNRVMFHCFDSPCPEVILADGHVGASVKKDGSIGPPDKNYYKFLEGALDHYNLSDLCWRASATTRFASVYFVLKRELEGNDIAHAHKQIELPYGPLATDTAEKMLLIYTEANGEGCIIRDPDSTWMPERMHSMVKMKKLDDDEATVVGYTTGRRTDRGSKLLGMMGALVLDYEGKRLELSGFTNQERSLGPIPGATGLAGVWAEQNPDTEVPDWVQATHFPRGSVITFTYRDKSDDGIPQEARYWRPHTVV